MTRRGIVRVIILLFILIIIGGAIAYFLDSAADWARLGPDQ